MPGRRKVIWGGLGWIRARLEAILGTNPIRDSAGIKTLRHRSPGWNLGWKLWKKSLFFFFCEAWNHTLGVYLLKKALRTGGFICRQNLEPNNATAKPGAASKAGGMEKKKGLNRKEELEFWSLLGHCQQRGNNLG